MQTQTSKNVFKSLCEEKWFYIICVHHGKVRVSVRASPLDLQPTIQPTPCKDYRDVEGT